MGAVAQLGERLVRNEEVSGSIPLSSTIKSINRGIELASVVAFLSNPLLRARSLFLFLKRKHRARPSPHQRACSIFSRSKLEMEQKQEILRAALRRPHRRMVEVLRNLEARVGIEPTHKGFADLSLTTWVPRLIQVRLTLNFERGST